MRPQNARGGRWEQGAVRHEASKEQAGVGQGKARALVKRGKGYESCRDKQETASCWTLPPMPGLPPERGPFTFYLEV